MKQYMRTNRMIRWLTAGAWLVGVIFFPLAGETALPARPQASGAVAAEEASRPQHTALKPETRVATDPDTPSKSTGAPVTAAEATNTPTKTSQAANVPAAVSAGYTEAEIREQMVRRHTLPKSEFRRVSGAVADKEYRPGSMDVKIPSLFFPADVMQEVSETFLENPDGTFGTRTSGEQSPEVSSYGKEAQEQLQKQEGIKAGDREPGTSAQAGATDAPVKQKNLPHTGVATAKAKYKTITVQVPAPAASPFRPLTAGDFRRFTSRAGHYEVALPASMPSDPLENLPANGPMLLRKKAQNEFMAVTADDPSDTYYYKNQNTFPDYGKAVPVFTETRKNIQGDDVTIRYIRYHMDGQYCLIVDSAGKKGDRTYRTAVIFPESKQYEYLPKALYMIENLKEKTEK